MNEVSKVKGNVEQLVAARDVSKSDKWVGACVCFIVALVAPLLVALWLANVGVMARAWHWMLGGF